MTINKGDIKPYKKPARMPGQTDEQYAQSIADAMAEASVAKAKVVAAAINEAFKDEFKMIKKPNPMMAFQGLKGQMKKIKVNGKSYETNAFYGDVTIPGVTAIEYGENGILGEGGNAGQFKKQPKGSSPGSRGSLQRMTPGVQTVATGIDSDGDPSEVDFGLVGTYVATVTPIPGMSDATVLETLASMLDAHGVPASFDPSTTTLSLDNVIPAGTMLDWGNTDTGLAFTMSMETVPEPSSRSLTIVALALLLCARFVAGRVCQWRAWVSR